MCVKNLPKIVTKKGETAEIRTRDLLSLKSSALTLRHQATQRTANVSNNLLLLLLFHYLTDDDGDLRLALGAAVVVAGHTAVRAGFVGGHVAHLQCKLVLVLRYYLLAACPQLHIVLVPVTV